MHRSGTSPKSLTRDFLVLHYHCSQLVTAHSSIWCKSQHLTQSLLLAKLHFVRCYTKFLLKAVRSKEEPLVLFFAFFLMTRCCSAPIKLMILQHQSRGCHCLQACISFFFLVTTKALSNISPLSPPRTLICGLRMLWLKKNEYKDRFFKMNLQDFTLEISVVQLPTRLVGTSPERKIY